MRNGVIHPLPSGVFDLTTKEVTMWSYSCLNHRVAVRNHRKAMKLNRYLGIYPKDTKFVKGDEPTFSFTDLQIKSVFKILGLKS